MRASWCGFAFIVAGGLALSACSSEPEKVCVPGKSEECVGTGGCSGGQACNETGTGFGPCVCASDTPDSGTAADSGTSSDAGSSEDGGTESDGGSMDGGTGTCNPLAAPGAQGCGTGQKCTWITITETPSRLGSVGCVADGTAAVGEACTRGPAGETTGFDDCVAGAICINNACADLCGFDGSPEAACGAGEHCTAYADLFANDSEEPTAGACTPTCNPVTQQFADGGTCPANQGCYLLVSSTTTIAVCAGAGTIQHNQEIIGTAYANSCEPGHMPRRRDQTTMVVECGALCAPANVTSTTNQSDEGGVAPNDCVARGAAAPGDGTTGESCRYWWMREPGGMVTPFSNTVGWCFKHATFQYDSDGDMAPDAPFPRCVNLTTGDIEPPIENPPGNDALYFGCIELPTMRRLSGPNLKPARLVRPPSVSLPERGLRLDRIDGW